MKKKHLVIIFIPIIIFVIFAIIVFKVIPSLYFPKQNATELEGIWNFVSQEKTGSNIIYPEDLINEGLELPTLVIEGDKATFNTGEEVFEGILQMKTDSPIDIYYLYTSEEYQNLFTISVSPDDYSSCRLSRNGAKGGIYSFSKEETK